MERQGSSSGNWWATIEPAGRAEVGPGEIPNVSAPIELTARPEDRSTGGVMELIAHQQRQMEFITNQQQQMQQMIATMVQAIQGQSTPVVVSNSPDDTTPTPSVGEAEQPPPTAAIETGESIPVGDSALDWKNIALTVLRNPLRSSVSLTREKPSFSGQDFQNPVRFLEEFEGYFRRLQATPEVKVDEIVSCLTQQAQQWARLHKSTWKEFGDFQIDFLDAFWSLAKQNRRRTKILSQPYEVNRGTTMAEFFIERANELKTLTPVMEEYAIVETLMGLMPDETQNNWLTKGNERRTLKEAFNFLQRLKQPKPPKRERTEYTFTRAKEPPSKRVFAAEFRTRPTQRRTNETQVSPVQLPDVSTPPPNFQSGNGRRT